MHSFFVHGSLPTRCSQCKVGQEIKNIKPEYGYVCYDGHTELGASDPQKNLHHTHSPTDICQNRVERSSGKLIFKLLYQRGFFFKYILLKYKESIQIGI
jgi:hypothetical protein